MILCKTLKSKSLGNYFQHYTVIQKQISVHSTKQEHSFLVVFQPYIP